MIPLLSLIGTIRDHFAALIRLKNADLISSVPGCEKIQVEDWNDTTGFFTVYLYRDTWPVKIECFEKNFFPWELADYCKAQGIYKGKRFGEWWNGWNIERQRPIVEEFIRANDPMLQKELDQYYS
jgi:hypothetical protein